MEQADLAQRLRASSSVASLRAEQECALELQRLGWDWVEHGCYYTDPATGKPRELDVRAKHTWTRKLRRGEQSGRIDVLIEVKSLDGYHVVFAPQIETPDHARAQSSWCGRSVDDDLLPALIEAGLEHEQAALIRDRIRRVAYPRGVAGVEALIVDPPDTMPMCTTFRETNIGNVRDPQASVVWGAIQAVWGAVAHSLQRDREVWESNLHSFVQHGATNAKERFAVAVRELSREVSFVFLYHPAVVLGAKLWLFDKDELTPVRYVRFLETGSFPPRWCDVVARESFPEWAKEITRHYAIASGKAGRSRRTGATVEEAAAGLLNSMVRRHVFEQHAKGIEYQPQFPGGQLRRVPILERLYPRAGPSGTGPQTVGGRSGVGDVRPKAAAQEGRN